MNRFFPRPAGWLPLAQLAWIFIAITAVGMFVAGIPFGLVAYSQISPFLTPELLASLQAQNISTENFATIMVASIAFSGFIWVLVGVLIFVRKRGTWLALVISLALVTFGTQSQLRGALVQAVPDFTWPAYLLTLISWVSLALFFALFPNGQFVPRWIRWFILLWTAGIIVPPQVNIVVPEAVTGLFFFAFWALLPLAQVYRYSRVSSSVERLQTKWVIFGFIILLTIYVPVFTLYFVNPSWINSPYVLILGNASSVIIPISIGIAILRARLFDIDLIIRQTLQYSLLTGLLGLVYFGSVVLFQGIFRTASGDTSSLAIVLSTLSIAALFAPLRQRVQAFIDRRFYRRKYDAAQVLARFATVARDEVEMEKLTAALVNVIETAVQPEKVSVWVKQTEKPKRATNE